MSLILVASEQSHADTHEPDLSQELASTIRDNMRQTHVWNRMPVTNEPMHDIWREFDATLMAMRYPLYHHILRKFPKKFESEHFYVAATQAGLALLASFCLAVGTRQIVVSNDNAGPMSVSFQPRPFGGSWNRQWGIHPETLNDPEKDPFCQAHRPPRVTTSDMMLMALKTTHVALRRHWGTLPQGVATMMIGEFEGAPAITFVFKERDGTRHCTSLE